MRRLALLLALAVVASSAVPASAGLEDELEEVGGEIASIRSEIEAKRSERTAIGDKVIATDARMRSLIEDLQVAEADVASVSASIGAGEQRLSEIKADLESRYQALDTTRRELEDADLLVRRQAVALYMSGGQDLSTIFILTDEVTELAVGLEYAERASLATEEVAHTLDALRVQETGQAEAVAELEADVSHEIDLLRQQRQELESVVQEVESRKGDVENELAVQRNLLGEIEATIEEFDKELDALEREQGRIEALIRQAQSGDGKAPGILVRPVPGGITSPFGNRVHPITGMTRLHTGLDMSAGYGQPIQAGAPGVVLLASYFGGYGNTVIIDHGGGMSTLYAHQSELAVNSGASVEAGQVVGYVGSTGFSTGPHLHFEVRLGGSPVNPAVYL